MSMFKPEDIPLELPEDVKSLLGALKPEPPELVERRKQLLAELTSQAASTTGPLQQLLIALREVFLGMQPEVPFKAGLSEEFSRALQRFGQNPAALNPPPALLTECMIYFRERVDRMGVGFLLESEDIPPRW
jgi:hypothetical protein